MSTLDKALENEGYVRWVQAGTCIGFVKKGIEKFAEEKSDVLFNRIKKNLNDQSSFTDMCKHISVEKMNPKWVMSCYRTGCKGCQSYIDELTQCRVAGFAFEKGHWKNSIIDIWPTSGWAMAKVFMNIGQDKNVQTVEDTDLSGLLNFIEHCSVANLAISNKANLKKVRDIRNAVMHSSTFELSQPQFEDFTDSMKDLLEDQTALNYDPRAMQEVKHIKEARRSTFTITTDAEFRVLRDRALELQRQNKTVQDNVSQMQARCDELEGKGDEESEATLAELVKEIEEQEKKLQELDETFSKLSSFSLRKEDLKAKMKPHTASTSTALYDTRDMLTKVRKSYRLLTKQELDVIEEATDQCQTLEERYDALEELTQRLVAENNDIKTASEMRIKELQQEMDDLKQSLRVQTEKCDKELQRANQLKDELEAVDREKHSTELELEKAREEVKQITAERTKQAMHMEEMKQKNCQLENDLSEKQIKQDAMLKKINQVNAENEQLKQQIEVLNDCTTKEKQKGDLYLKEAERLTKRNQEIEVKLEQLQRKLASCEEGYKCALTRNENMAAELKTTKKEKNSNEFEVRKLLADLNELIAKKFKQNEENKLLKEKVAALNDSITKAEQKNASYLEEIESLTRRNDEIEVHRGELYLQIGMLKDRLTIAEKNNETNQWEIETLEIELEKCKRKLSLYAIEMPSIKAENQELHKQLQSLINQISRTETEKKQLENENRILQNKVDRLKAERKTMKGEIGLLSNELVSVKGLHSQYKKDIDGVCALKQQNDMLRKTDTAIVRVWCLSVILYVVVFVIVYWDEVLQM